MDAGVPVDVTTEGDEGPELWRGIKLILVWLMFEFFFLKKHFLWSVYKWRCVKVPQSVRKETPETIARIGMLVSCYYNSLTHYDVLHTFLQSKPE